MALDNTLAKQFASAVAGGNTKKEKQTETRGIAKTIDGKLHAVLNGSTLATPVESTVTANDGDELLLAIKDHRAMVIGNITSNAIDENTFYSLLEDGSLNIAVNNLDVAADGSITISSGALFKVLAGAGVNLNDALILTEDGQLLLDVTGLTVAGGGTVNLNDRLILTSDGHLILNVDTFSLGGSAGIDNLDDLKGKDGAVPEISSDGYWILDGVKTEFSAVGDDGHSPYIGSNGYWYEWNSSSGSYQNTWIEAQGPQGEKGDTGPQGPQGPAGTVSHFYYDSSYGVLLYTGSSTSYLGSFTQVTSGGFYIKSSSGGVSSATTLASFTSSTITLGKLTIYNGGTGSLIYYGDTQLLLDGSTAGLSNSNADLYVYENSIKATADLTIDGTGTATKFQSSGSYLHTNVGPLTSGGASCGSSTYKWSKVYAETGTIQTSSIHTKENIEPVSAEKASRLLDVNVVKFDYTLEHWKREKGRKGWYGVIAEEVHDLFPEVVLDWDTETEIDDLTGEEVPVYPGVTYEGFIPHIIKLCQMQQQQIDDLKARVEALEAK